jgi:hypothetical protein
MACSGIALAFSSRSSSCNRVIRHIICNFSFFLDLCLCNAFEMSVPRLCGVTLHFFYYLKTLESIQRKFATLCHYRFYRLGNLRRLLVCLNLRKLYSRRRNLNYLFQVNAFNGKIICHSILDTVGIRVRTKQIR